MLPGRSRRVSGAVGRRITTAAWWAAPPGRTEDQHERSRRDQPLWGRRGVRPVGRLGGDHGRGQPPGSTTRGDAGRRQGRRGAVGLAAVVPRRQSPFGRPEPPNQGPHRVDRSAVRREETEVHVRNARVAGGSASSDEATDRHPVPGGQVPGVRAEMCVVPEAPVVPIDVRDLPAERIRPEADRSLVCCDDRSSVPAEDVLTVVRVVAAGPSGCTPTVRPGRGPLEDEGGVDPICDPGLGPAALPRTSSHTIEVGGPEGPPPRIGCPALPGSLVVMPAALCVPEFLVTSTEGVTVPNLPHRRGGGIRALRWRARRRWGALRRRRGARRRR
jgi:hypothetical protein